MPGPRSAISNVHGIPLVLKADFDICERRAALLDRGLGERTRIFDRVVEQIRQRLPDQVFLSRTS